MPEIITEVNIMADIMSFSPLWGEWHIRELVGRGSFGAVYKAEKTEYGNTYTSAIKHLSIPPQNMTKEMLVSEGIATDDKTLSLYCDTLRDRMINEINFCYTLRGNTNIVSYEDHCIIPKSSGIGYDIFIRMELLTALPKYLSEHNMNEREVIKLGIELCEALNVLHMNHIIHRDIKPANIFVNSRGVFKLGDFGESKVLSNSSMGMTIRGTYAYISPEISKGEGGNITADIYSLGLVMYRLLNGNRAPFLPVAGQPVDSVAAEKANIRRLKGEPLPAPAFCTDPMLSNVVLKACEFRKESRWQTPDEMKKALEAIRDRRGVTVTQPYSATYQTTALPVQPVQTPQPSMIGGQMNYTSPSFYNASVSYPQSAVQYPVQQKKKSRLPLIIGISGAALAVIIAVIIIIAVASSGKGGGNQTDAGSVVSTPSTVVSTPSAVVSTPSAVVSTPSTASTGTMTVREYFETDIGKADKKQAEEMGAQEESIVSMTVSTEGENTMVYDVVLNAIAVTDEQKQLMEQNMEQQRASVQNMIKTVMLNFGVSQFDVVYRYRTKDGSLISEFRIAL